MTHTLGSWSACHGGECKCGSIYGGDGNTQVGVAYGPMHVDDFLGPDNVPSKEGQKANAALIANAPTLLEAVKLAYRKHHLGDESIGWDELSEAMLNVLCETMGDAEFVAFVNEYGRAER